MFAVITAVLAQVWFGCFDSYGFSGLILCLTIPSHD